MTRRIATRHLFAAITLLGTAAAAWAQGGDPLDSLECRRALSALQAAEDQALAKAPGASLAERRRDAARACLRTPDGAAPARAPQMSNPPTAPSARIEVPAAPASPPAAPPAARPVAPPPPQTITSCDAAGCWTNDGTRLQRFGTGFIGPRGVCTMQGVVLDCRQP